MQSDQSWSLAWRLARREMKGSLSKFRIFLSALVLGVAAIGAVGSVAQSMRTGIGDNARILLGGDFEISSRHTAVDEAVINAASNLGKITSTIGMRAMLHNPANGERKLVELKAVDDAWPLIGTAKIQGPDSLSDGLALGSALVQPSLMRSLQLSIGDKVKLGEATLTIAGTLLSEPDRTVNFGGFGPRVLISSDTVALTGLIKPGSFISFRSKILLADPAKADEARQILEPLLSETHARLRDVSSAAPGFDAFIARAEAFLILVGLTALLIGGLGVGSAVRAWLMSRMPVIATLKCLGAPSVLIYRIYLLQIMAIAAIGVVIGLIIAATAPALTASVLSNYIAAAPVVSIFPQPLFIAGAFGLLTAFIFTLLPLARAKDVRASQLFRSLITPPSGIPAFGIMARIIAAACALTALALIATSDLRLTFGFIGGAIGALCLLALLGEMVMRLMRRIPSPSYVPGRLALSAITRQGSPLRAIIIAFGLGLSVLVAVTLTRHNLDQQISDRVADQAPDWFFIDIQPDQIDRFEAIATSVPGITDIQKTPMLRGRVSALAGVPAKEITPPEDSAWILRGDRAITWQAEPPRGGTITDGTWWQADYQGPPLISVSKDAFEAFNLQIGDTVSINVLGRNITATIANAREVEWESFSINFVFILSPGVLDKAPHSWIATTYAEKQQAIDDIEKQVTDEFSNVSAISVKEAVAAATNILDLLGSAIRLTALVTLISGIAVLAGTVASSEAQRLSDSIILKVLGARRKDILMAWMLEYALLGLLTALCASLIGTAASAALVSGFLQADFSADITVIASTAITGAAATCLLGLFGAWRSLGHRPAPHLRELA
ncbi:MAG: ABC transporter permease [Candidatus Puniceispirillaceae bacterium]